MVHKHSQSEGRFEHAYQNNNEFDKIWTKKIINNLKKNGNI
jgi:serine/threonine-protein kinase RIO1